MEGQLIKVIHVISDTNIGGAGKCVLTYLENFDRDKFSVSVVFPKGSALKPAVEMLKVGFFEVEGMADRSMDIACIMALWRYFKKEKPDIVHTHASVSARIAARLAGVPAVLYTRHCVYAPKRIFTTWWGGMANSLLTRLLCTHIIAVADAAKENIVREGVPEKLITVVQNGVQPLVAMPSADIPKVKKQFGIRDGDFVTALVARVEEVKGHMTYIQAAKILKDRHIPIKCLIVGTGKMENGLRKMVVDLQLEDTVIFAGFLKDVSPIMNMMDVQINASFGTEATSLSLLEGMSLGKPAVATDFGGNPGVIENGQNGLLVPVKNAQAMADAIESIYVDNKRLQYLIARSREIFETKFTARHMARNIENVYDSLKKGRG
ncbi:MAG: glycosyltransferase [Hyphomonadaceae bacterium]|nr:glycosyltransferase [Clostridia bacterium]